MNQLIVFAHPDSKSFNKAIVDTIQKISEEKRANTKICDLYGIRFDPVLKPSDFEALHNRKVPEDINTEQENVKWADIITFVYPTWWAGFPAILKGYVDRVFSYGFAYQYIDGVPTGLLKGKKALLFTTTGSPSEIYDENGMHNSMKQVSDMGIFNFSGIEVVSHTFFGAVPSVDDETRKGYLKEVEKIFREKL